MAKATARHSAAGMPSREATPGEIAGNACGFEAHSSHAIPEMNPNETSGCSACFLPVIGGLQHHKHHQISNKQHFSTKDLDDIQIDGMDGDLLCRRIRVNFVADSCLDVFKAFIPILQ